MARTIARFFGRIWCAVQFLRKGKWDKFSSRALRARAVGTRGRAGIGASLRIEWRSPRRRACGVREQREPTLSSDCRGRFPAHWPVCGSVFGTRRNPFARGGLLDGKPPQTDPKRADGRCKLKLGVSIHIAGVLCRSVVSFHPAHLAGETVERHVLQMACYPILSQGSHFIDSAGWKPTSK